MLDDILVKVDRCSMLHSLEVRAPFLDKDFAEYVARLPIRHKLHGFQRKYLLKKAFTDVLPPEILHRNKRGFQIPVAAWLRGRMRPLMEELFAPERLRAQGLFRPEAVRSLVDGNAIVPYESMTYERPDMTQFRLKLCTAYVTTH